MSPQERAAIRTLMITEALSILSKEQLLVLVLRNAYGLTIAETCRATRKHYRWVEKRYWEGLTIFLTYWGIDYEKEIV